MRWYLIELSEGDTDDLSWVDYIAKGYPLHSFYAVTKMWALSKIVKSKNKFENLVRHKGQLFC